MQDGGALLNGVGKIAINKYACDCAAATGYEGTNCADDVDEWCGANASALGVHRAAPTRCPTPFAVSARKRDEATPGRSAVNPCKNLATCADSSTNGNIAKGAYECTCADGYSVRRHARTARRLALRMRSRRCCSDEDCRALRLLAAGRARSATSTSTSAWPTPAPATARTARRAPTPPPTPMRCGAAQRHGDSPTVSDRIQHLRSAAGAGQRVRLHLRRRLHWHHLRN